MTTDILDILSQARNSLGPFCKETCHAKCCKLGKLLLSSKKQVRIISKGKMKRLYTRHQLQDISPQRTDLILAPFGCPALTPSSTCSIFHSSFRPKICDEYPLFLRGKTVFVASSCVAVQQGLLHEALEEIRSKGYRVVEQ